MTLNKKSLMQLPTATFSISMLPHQMMTSSHSLTLFGMTHLLSAPEVIVSGLHPQNAHNVLFTIFEEAKEGSQFCAGQSYDNVLRGYAAFFLEVESSVSKDYLSLAWWAHGNQAFPAMQCIWPDRNGKYPWDPSFDKSEIQEIVGKL